MERYLKVLFLKKENNHIGNRKGTKRWKDLKIHRDQMTDYKHKVDKMKDDIARKNREIQKEREKKKKKWLRKSQGKNLDFFYNLCYNIFNKENIKKLMPLLMMLGGMNGGI